MLVIGNGLFVRQAGGILGDIAHQDAAGRGLLDVPDGVIDAFVVDSHPVDKGLVLGQAEQPGTGIAVLRLGGQGTHLHEGEAEIGQFVVKLGVLIQSGGQSHWGRETEPEKLPLQRRRIVPIQKADQG